MAHTARPGKPESDRIGVEAKEEVRPLEARARSAGMYYGAVAIEDGLSPNGGPGPEQEVSAEDEEENRDLADPAGDKEEKSGPKVIRVP